MTTGRAGLRLRCHGVVQGVGLRPALARLATALGLDGCLANIPGAVRLELAGPRPALERFLAELPAALPAAAQLEALHSTWLTPPLPAALAEGTGVRIAAVAPQPLGAGLVAPSLLADRAPCRACRRELRDPSNRRFRHPFISCCACGPRYSIARATPFSRAHTSLAAFPLCRSCQAEFDDPGDRRFHAETIGCPACGPQLRLLDADGRRIAGPELPIGRQSTGLEPVCSARHATQPARVPATAEGCNGPTGPPDPDGPQPGPATTRRAAAGTGSCRPAAAWGQPSDPLEAAVALLRRGRILALQGVGGFQLLVDARNREAVARLRQRKRRPHKPFALLVDSPTRLEPLVRPTGAERAALTDPAAPIVLLPCPDDAHEMVLAGVAPGAPALGVMLPASPLHLLLAEAFAGPLVATSGNRSGEPLCIEPTEAVARLAGIAEAFLVHDRPIVRPLDDSVLQLIDGRPALLRRARGYAPEALRLPPGPASTPQAWSTRQPCSMPQPCPPADSNDPEQALLLASASPDTAGTSPRLDQTSDEEREPGPTLLALGSDLKSAPALAIGDRLWLAPQLGDLADSRCQARWRAGVTELLTRHCGALSAVAVDAHPDYVSHQLAPLLLQAAAAPGRPRRQAATPGDGPTLQTVAHHRAHGLAVVAEHSLPLPLPALVLDGLGYGEGSVPLWGCELLWLEPGGARRLASLRPFPLPGGERAVREPRRSGLGLLWAAGLLQHPGAAAVRSGFGAAELPLLLQAITTGCNSPWCSSAGRLFDAVAALLDLVQIASHDAHAGLQLQAAAGRAPARAGAYPLPLRAPSCSPSGPAAPGAKNEGSPAWLDWQPLLAALLQDVAAGHSQELCAARFHGGLMQGLTTALLAQVRPAPGQAVVLAGGCFQNRLLLEGLIGALRQRGLRPFWGERIPLHDGGLAAGQILALRQAPRSAPTVT